ncbi:hypothetical protein B0T25DRAFT_519021 [Lasiosphaeria hispida]|uniref:Uncharacterized protein n=1 Tax=Lasiosphaeria hispida TaxID=260671 RepID=A0AAJ0MBJ7_9PEZI|nr:hypothetical protein B0T25DRAFT_519021 [Lasiosphaeria hispida]
MPFFSPSFLPLPLPDGFLRHRLDRSQGDIESFPLPASVSRPLRKTTEPTSSSSSGLDRLHDLEHIFNMVKSASKKRAAREARRIEKELEVARSKTYYHTGWKDFIGEGSACGGSVGEASGGSTDIVAPFPILNLPFELQCKIWTEAIRKPNIHFIQAKKVFTSMYTWGLKTHPVPKAQDKSGFRQQTAIAAICPSAKEAVHMANAEKQQLPFPVLRGVGDAATDVVAIKFETVAKKSSATLGAVDSWDNDFQFVIPVLDHIQVATKLAGIHRAAIHYTFALPAQQKMEEYLQHLFKLTPEERTDMGVEVFHSIDGLYLEFSRDVVARYDPSALQANTPKRGDPGLFLSGVSVWCYFEDLFSKVQERLHGARSAGIEYRTSLAHRQALQFKVLVPLDALLAASMGIKI